MDNTLNPFRPGAGTRPPELAGRQSEIDYTDLVVARSRANRNDAGLILYGLRGVGKTVLLNELRSNIERAGWVTVSLEARLGPSGHAASRQALARGLAKVARQMKRFKSAASDVAAALSTINSFTMTVAGVSVGIEGPQHTRQTSSPLLEVDFEELVSNLAQPLRKNQCALAIFVDEMQDLDDELLSALLSAQHRATQEDWPFYIFGAGLVTLRRMLSESRSYTERFTLREIGALSREASIDAVLKPATNLGVSFDDDALDLLLAASQGYPYFLQTYGKHVWDLAPERRIDYETVKAGIEAGNDALDQSFFPARWDRCSDSERQYLRAIVEVGGNSASTGAIAQQLNTTQPALSTVRESLLRKGMIYADRRGSVSFTVPHMDAFVLRQHDS